MWNPARAMDPMFRRRNNPELDSAPREPDYNTALSQETAVFGPSGDLHVGEASPGTLEQGGAGLTDQGRPVASPFHSDKVQAEVALARSRPRSLDDDARRMAEMNEAGLGDLSMAGRGDEPNYADQDPIHDPQPRVARIEHTFTPFQGLGHSEGDRAAVGEGSPSRDDSGVRGAPEPLGVKRELGQRDVTLAAGVREFGSSPDRPGLGDTRELVPVEVARADKLEGMLLKIMEENRLLRDRLDQVERSSWHSGVTRGTADVAGASPVSFAPLSDRMLGAHTVQPQQSRSLEVFVGEGDLRDNGGHSLGDLLVHRQPVPHSDGRIQGQGILEIEWPNSGNDLSDRSGHGDSLRNPAAGDEFGVPVQSFGEFRQMVQGQGARAESGFVTPRSGNKTVGESFDGQGYPVSPGGTVIRPPPGPPPLSPRGVVGAVTGPSEWGGPRVAIPSPPLPDAGLRPEEPAKYISELPKLAAADLSVSAVTCGNWLAQVKQIFVGLSPSASVWYDSVETAAYNAYNRWLVADPLGRLSIDPASVVAGFDVARFQRVESRSVTLLLAAVPAHVRDDLVMNRWLHSSSILFRILCLWQPGGSSERAHLLSQLVTPEVCRSLKESLPVLRRWQQHLNRAREIRATLPDPSLLLKGVDQSTVGLLSQYQMIAFRVNAYRHRAALDYDPSVVGVVQLVRLLQAEFESAAIALEGAQGGSKGPKAAVLSASSGVPKPSPEGSPTVAVAKVGGADPPGGTKGKGKGKGDKGDVVPPCHNFSNAAGCKYGDSCRFKHDRAAARKERRCLACGQQGHFRPDCTLVPAEHRQVQGPEGVSDSSPSPKAAEPKRGGAKAKPKAGVQAKGVTEDATTGSGPGSQIPQSPSPASSSAPSQQELLAEAQKLLKGVVLKAARVDTLEGFGIDRSWLISAIASASDPAYALVDSGATNGLRQAEPGEWARTRAIKVDLASGVAELHIDERGTLLSSEPCQVIVPAGYLIELGYTVSWKRKGCIIRHPQCGKLEVSVVKGCPLISREEGLRLLREYESLQDSDKCLRKSEIHPDAECLTPDSARAWLRGVVESKGKQGPSRGEQECFLRGMFPELPQEYVSRISVPALDPGEIDLSRLPWNRRFRRSIARSKPGSVLLHLFSETRSWKGFSRTVGIGKACQSDLMVQPIFQQVLSWASAGKIGGLVGGLPRESVLPRPTGCEGGALDRGRFEDRWGVSDLPGDRQRCVVEETISWFRFFLVFSVAQAVRDVEGLGRDVSRDEVSDTVPEGLDDPKELALWALRVAARRLATAQGERAAGPRAWGASVFLVFEHPSDPVQGVGLGVNELSHYPSVWASREFRDFIRVYGLYEATFDQDVLGGLGYGSTTVATSSWFLFENLHALEQDPGGCGRSENPWCKGRHGWSIGLLRVIQGAWLGWCAGRERGDSVSERKALLAKLTEDELLRRHIENDHVPYLKGCPTCIAAQGRQRSHWRAGVTSLYSISCDLAGPFKDGLGFDATASGRDRGRGYKYFLSAAYSVPVEPVHLRPERSASEELTYFPSEEEGLDEGSKVSGLEFFDLDDPESVSGGFGLKALFRRLKEKTFPPVEPLDSSTSFAVPRSLEPGSVSQADDTKANEDRPKVKTKTLFMGVPLRSKHGKAVMAQVQALVGRLESMGFPIHRYFSDRAKELRSHDLVLWLRGKGIYASFTAGEDPQGNKAELGVQQLKQGVRRLLQASDLDSSLWPLALLHMSNRNLHELCTALGQPRPALLPFGTSVQARKRLASGHKKHWEPRTVPGRYLGQAPDCTGGHLVLLGGRSTDFKVLLTNTVYPVRPGPAPPKPKFRLKGKSAPGFEIRTVAAALRCWSLGRPSVARLSPGGECLDISDFKADQEGFGDFFREVVFERDGFGTVVSDVEDSLEPRSDAETELEGFSDDEGSGVGVSVRVLSDEKEQWLSQCLETGSYGFDEALEVLRYCAGTLRPPNRKMMAGKGRYAVMGLYNQGGFNGLSRFGSENGSLVRYLNRFVAAQGCDHAYTTLYLSFNTSAPLHKDARNDPDVPVWIVALGEFRGGGVWIEGDDNNGPVLKEFPGGDVRSGWVHNIRNEPCVFRGSRWHCTEPWCGTDRWVIAAYVPRGAKGILGQYSQGLRNLGFNVDGLAPDAEVEGVSISKCKEASVSLAGVSNSGHDCGFRDHSCSGLERDEDYSWEIEFPCEALSGDWQPEVVQAHLTSARLCKVLSKELSGCDDDQCHFELFQQLRAEECRREWYEGLLWDEHFRVESPIVRALRADVPLDSDEPVCAAEVFLQTRTVSIQEARKELSLWIPAAKEEIHSLEEAHQAVVRIQASEIEDFVKAGRRVVQVPGKAVLTRKSGVGKRRFRCVACGNFIPQTEGDASVLYASGIEGVTLRAAIAYAATRSWSGLTADIKTAFLNAPLDGGCDEGTEEVVIVRPPYILIEMGLLKNEHRWRVVKALYGLRQAPKAWAVHRDKLLTSLEFSSGGESFVLRQSIADESLWYVFKKERSGEECHALLVVYVDDILGLGPDVILVELFRAIRRIWTLSEPEWIVRDKSVRFCGIELQTLDGGFRMAQSDYLRELFARYEIVSSVSCPITAWNDPVPEEAPRPEIVKEAQALTGALLWAASKTRPDISFSVSKLGQFAVKAPDTVVKAGYQVLKYLFGTVELGIEYRRPVGTEWADAPVPRTLETIELFTDASHAPEGGKSNQAIFILWNNMLVAWEASKQPFTTLSSAEAELVVVMAGIVAAESIGAIFEELLSRDIIISALCDNQASVRACACGSLGWRSRHLRMRAAAARERIAAGALVVTYIPGERQIADLATKPLQTPRIMQLLDMLSIRSRVGSEGTGGQGRVLSRLFYAARSVPLVSAEALAGLALMSAIRGANAQPSNDGYVLEFEGVLGWLIGWVFVGVMMIWAWWLLQGRSEDSGVEVCQPSIECQSHSIEEPDQFDEVPVSSGEEGFGSGDFVRVRGLQVLGSHDGAGSQGQIGGSIDCQLPSARGCSTEGLNQFPSALGCSADGLNQVIDLLGQNSGLWWTCFGAHAVEWWRLRTVHRRLNANPTLIVFSQLSDTGVVQQGNALAGYTVTCEFNLVGGQYQWVPVALSVVGHGAQETASGSSVPHEEGASGPDIHGEFLQGDYEDHYEVQVSFPYVGDYLVRHFLEQLLSVEGSRILFYLGERSEGWMRLRQASASLRYSLAGAVVDLLRQGPWSLVFSGPQWLGAVEEYLCLGCVDPGFEAFEEAEGTGGAQSSHEVAILDDGPVFPYVLWAPPLYVHYLRRILALSGTLLLSLLGDRSAEWVRLRTASRSFGSGVVLALVPWLQGHGLVNRYVDGAASYDAATAYLRVGQGFVDPESDGDDATLDDRPHRQFGPLPNQVALGFNPMLQAVFHEDTSSSEDSEDSTTEPSVADASPDHNSSSAVSEDEPMCSGNVLSVGDSAVISANTLQQSGIAYEADDERLLVHYLDDTLIVPLPGWSLVQVGVVVQGLNTGVWSGFREALDAVAGNEEVSQPRSSEGS